MSTATTQDVLASEKRQPEDRSIGLNVERLWSYLCAVATLTEPSLAKLSVEVPRVALMTPQPPSDDWAVSTLFEIADMAWAWEIPAALEILAEMAADEAIAGSVDERLRSYTGRFGRLLTYFEGPYVELAERVMKELGERKRTARAAADATAHIAADAKGE